ALPQPPKRSVMLLFVAAEEQGLLGSKYYAEHPTVAPGNITANINVDGGNIFGRAKDIVFVGKGKSTIDDYVAAIAKMQDRVVTPDQFADRGFFYRSDQFNFAKIGVPALYLDTGTDFIGKPAGWGKEQHAVYEQKHYHQPSDEIQADWNYDGMIEDAQLMFYVGDNIANASPADAPKWLPGDEFEAARKAAQAQLTTKTE
ncbi:MAG: M28 family peptidase, partial [Pseudomonadota bacterium]|nr:M28 family peptidase [Pseudomonadota bacterium]